MRQALITPASRSPRRIEHLYTRSLTTALLELERPLRSEFNSSDRATMSTAARRRLMRDFKVRHPCSYMQHAARLVHCKEGRG
jgi:hypothetical protein